MPILKTISIPNLKAVLEELGPSSLSVAHNLNRKNIKGTPGNCYECPLSTYIKQVFDAKEVSVSDEIVVKGYGQAIAMDLPDHLLFFTTRFDEGQYKYLEKVKPRRHAISASVRALPKDYR